MDVAGGEGEGAGEGGGEVGEVEDGCGALDGYGGDVVCPGGHVGVGERAEPDSGLLPGLPDLRHPLPPAPHPHSAVHRVLAALAPHRRSRPVIVISAASTLLHPRRRRFGRGSSSTAVLIIDLPLL